jgi:hypothetical protein
MCCISPYYRCISPYYLLHFALLSAAFRPTICCISPYYLLRADENAFLSKPEKLAAIFCRNNGIIPSTENRVSGQASKRLDTIEGLTAETTQQKDEIQANRKLLVCAPHPLILLCNTAPCRGVCRALRRCITTTGLKMVGSVRRC